MRESLQTMHDNILEERRKDFEVLEWVHDICIHG